MDNLLGIIVKSAIVAATDFKLLSRFCGSNYTNKTDQTFTYDPMTSRRCVLKGIVNCVEWVVFGVPGTDIRVTDELKFALEWFTFIRDHEGGQASIDFVFHAKHACYGPIEIISKARSRNWHAGVPSFSKPGDGPSRGELHATALKWNVVRVQVQHMLE
eukprot:553805-Amphidinium_carterae.1